MLQGGSIIGLVQAHHAMGLGFFELEPLGMRFLGHSGKGLVGFGELVLPGPGRGFLQTIIQAVGFVLRALDGLVVLRSRPDLIALQRVGVPQPKLRRNESRINFQGCAVWLESSV